MTLPLMLSLLPLAELSDFKSPTLNGKIVKFLFLANFNEQHEKAAPESIRALVGVFSTFTIMWQTLYAGGTGGTWWLPLVPVPCRPAGQASYAEFGAGCTALQLLEK